MLTPKQHMFQKFVLERKFRCRRNIQSMAAKAQVHLVDWLGTGLSGRPQFTCSNQEETEAWFVDSLQQWRAENGITKFVLVGHSLGGYLAANYALRYPEHVEHLVLVCPAGMVRTSQRQ